MEECRSQRAGGAASISQRYVKGGILRGRVLDGTLIVSQRISRIRRSIAQVI